MARLIVTADIHGSFSTWSAVKTLLKKDDTLVVAGDLFDTKYGNYANSDFQPDSIKSDLSKFKHQFHYVYGNCDIPSFFPGSHSEKTFTAFKKQIFLHHGHNPCNDFKGSSIIIQGHTHIASLKEKNGHILMNPGSITYPKQNGPTYGVIDENSVSIINLKTENRLDFINF